MSCLQDLFGLPAVQFASLFSSRLGLPQSESAERCRRQRCVESSVGPFKVLGKRGFRTASILWGGGESCCVEFGKCDAGCIAGSRGLTLPWSNAICHSSVASAEEATLMPDVGECGCSRLLDDVALVVNVPRLLVCRDKDAAIFCGHHF